MDKEKYEELVREALVDKVESLKTQCMIKDIEIQSRDNEIKYLKGRIDFLYTLIPAGRNTEEIQKEENKKENEGENE